MAAKSVFAAAIAPTYANGQLNQRVLQRQANSESPQYSVPRPKKFRKIHKIHLRIFPVFFWGLAAHLD